MRIQAFLLAFLPLPLCAETFVVTSGPQSVTVYSGVAEVTREITLDLPAGSHSIRLPDLPRGIGPTFTTAEVVGAQLVNRTFQTRPTRDENWPLQTPETEAARQTLEQAEDALAELNRDIARAEAAIRAADAEIAYLARLGTQETLPGDSAALLELGQGIAAATEAAYQRRVDTEGRVADLRKSQEPLQRAVDRARDRFEFLQIPLDDTRQITLDVLAPQAGEIGITLTYWVPATWRPVYRFDLQTGDDPMLFVERGASITQNSGEHWSDVTLSVSGIPVLGQTAPSPTFPEFWRIVDEAAKTPRGYEKPEISAADSFEGRAAPAPIAQAAAEAGATVTAAGVTYDFPQPVSVATDRGAVEIALDTLEFSPEISAFANARSDTTAFRMLDFTNDTEERLIAFGTHPAFIDGQAIGTIGFDTIEAGDDVELPFGPLHGLQITRVVTSAEEGGSGFVNRSSDLNQTARIDVQNLTDRDWTVTVSDTVPYSEQEDLQVSWRARPVVTRQDVDDLRGALEWDIDVPARGTETIQLDLDVQWPEGMTLIR